jgi:hypothetical protein
MMIDENEQRWKKLARQAADEKDPQKLEQLVREINRLFDAKQNTNGHKTNQMDDLTRT